MIKDPTSNILQQIIESCNNRKRLLAVLIDPDKMVLENIPGFIAKVNSSIATHIFIGGSTVKEGVTEEVVSEVRKHTQLPVILFPGDAMQITEEAEAILFLSLISGRNPEFLIEQQIQSVTKLKDSHLEIIPTGYILIDGGVETAVQRISQTEPISAYDTEIAVHTALAGEFSGKRLIYLEAGSGAKNPVPVKMIQQVSKALSVPLIVGGGIRDVASLEAAYLAGADMVVIGTAFEENEAFFKELKK